MSRLVDALLFRQSLRRWTRASAEAERLGPERLRALRTRARDLQRQLDRVLFVADGRLTLPHVGSDAIQKPLHTDWSYRPEVWRGPIRPPGRVAVESQDGFGSELKVFHDCRISELTLRQVRNSRDTDLAPFGLRMDVFRFDGSFLSLVVELPDSAVRGLERRHIIRLTALTEVEHPLELFARLNIKNGPNIEQIVRELPMTDEAEMTVEFDLAYTKLNEKRVEQMWLDLIFEGAEMNQILLRDLVLTRRPRLEI